MIIVNGATGAIGKSVVQELSKTGQRVVGVGRNSKILEGLGAEIKGFVGIPVSDGRTQSQIKEFEKALDGLNLRDEDILGYAHCIGSFRRFESPLKISLPEWEEAIDVNLTSCFLWNQLILEKMVANSHGSIVNVISQAAKTGGFSPITPYAAAKGGIAAMTKNLSNWAGEYGVRINCVSPGFVDNQMMNEGLSSSSRAQLENRLPLKRFSTNSEIAKAIAFLISDDAEYITGTSLDVTGGLTNI